MENEARVTKSWLYVKARCEREPEYKAQRDNIRNRRKLALYWHEDPETREAYREKHRAYKRAYYERNKDALNANARKRRAEKGAKQRCSGTNADNHATAADSPATALTNALKDLLQIDGPVNYKITRPSAF